MDNKLPNDIMDQMGFEKEVFPDTMIPFKCDHCGQCCFDTKIILHPLDVYRMAKGLGMETGMDFLASYAAPMFIGPENAKYAVFLLHSKPNGFCILSKSTTDFEKGTVKYSCKAGEDKPFQCLSFPIGSTTSISKIENDIDGHSFYLLKDYCSKDSDEQVPAAKWLDKLNPFEKDRDLSINLIKEFILSIDSSAIYNKTTPIDKDDLDKLAALYMEMAMGLFKFNTKQSFESQYNKILTNITELKIKMIAFGDSIGLDLRRKD